MKKLMSILAVSVFVLSCMTVACTSSKTTTTTKVDPTTTAAQKTTVVSKITVTEPEAEKVSDHTNYKLSTCVGCHSDVEGHTYRADSCEECHPLGVADPVTEDVDHNDFDENDCAKCHIDAMSAGHEYIDPAQCRTCHTWEEAQHDHTNETISNCTSCHSDVKNHAYRADSCDECHSIGTELVTTNEINHAEFTANDCAKCHIDAMSAGHEYVDASICDTCHTWSN